MGVFPPSSSGYNNPKRRSERVMLKTPVVVLMRGDSDQRVAEHTRTATVNAHGALILSGLKLPVGRMFTLRNSRTDEEALCLWSTSAPIKVRSARLESSLWSRLVRTSGSFPFLPPIGEPKSPELSKSRFHRIGTRAGVGQPCSSSHRVQQLS